MKFISNETMEDGPLVFSDDEEEEKITHEINDFIDNGPQPEEDVSFYRQLDPANIDNYPKFNGQTSNLSSSVLEKFNGYEMIRNDLSYNEKAEVIPIDVVYEPICNETIPVPCYFTSEVHSAYRSDIGHFDKGKELISNRIVRQCYYCQNFFAKTKEHMKKHLSVCRLKEGITYAFDNDQILNYQDNFKYLGDLPFSVYFDFETTTRGNSVFFFIQLSM